MKSNRHLRFSAEFWAAAAPFFLFFVPLLRGRAIFWGLPSLQFIPWRHYAWSLLREGTLPLWNPLNGMGAPLLANYQLALFYPPAFPLFILNELFGAGGLAWGLTLLIPVHLAWGAAGMVRLMRQLGAGYRGQLVAGLAFGMSGYLVARGSFFSIIWAAAWLPWILCWLEKLVVASNRRDLVRAGLMLSLVLAMMLLAGHAQVSWYSLLLSSLWLIFRILQINRGSVRSRNIGWFAAAGFWAVLLAALQLLPTFEYLQQSQRAASYDVESAMVYSFSPLRLLGYLTPELFGNPGYGDFWGYATYWEDAVYIGLAPFLLALSTLPIIIRKETRQLSNRGLIIFLWGIAATGTLFALGANTPLFPWLFRNIPTFEMFQAPARWLLWPTLALAILAGLAAERWHPPSGIGTVRYNLAAFGGIILAISAGVASFGYSEWEPGLFRGFIFFGLTAAVTFFIARRIPSQNQGSNWSKLMAAAIILDLFAANTFLNPTVSVDIWAEGNQLADEINSMRSDSRVWMDPSTEQLVKYGWFFQFDDFTNREDWHDLRSSQVPNLNLLDKIPSVNNFDPLLPARYASWMELLADETQPVQQRWLGRASAGVVIFPDPSGTEKIAILPLDAEPRFSWVSCIFSVDSAQPALRIILQEVRNEKSIECVVIEDAPISEGIGDTTPAGEVFLVEETPNHILLEVQSTSPGWVLVRDTWYPGWLATLNGRLTTIFHADYLFKAVYVPAGIHELALEYRPNSFTIGLWISIFAWITWGAGWFLNRRWDKSGRRDTPHAP